MNDQGQCEACESLAHELAEAKRENEKLKAMLHDRHFAAMSDVATHTEAILKFDGVRA